MSSSSPDQKKDGPVWKILLLGDANTGKGSLNARLAYGTFQEKVHKMNPVLALKLLPFHSTTASLQLWGIGSAELHGQLLPVYCAKAHGAVVVCDITRPETFTAAVEWKLRVGEGLKESIPYVLLLNKCDLGPSLKSKEEMDAFCKDHGFCAWLEVSAKEGTNVEIAFEALAEAIADPMRTVTS